MAKINADLCHDTLIKNANLTLEFDKNKDFFAWRKELKGKFIELLGINKIRENDCPLEVKIESEEIVKKDQFVNCDYKRIRFIMTTERDMQVPCYLLIPIGDKKKYPLAITLQGHNKGGMANSVFYHKDENGNDVFQRGAHGLQAINEGYAGLCIEMRGMGELEPSTEPRMWGDMCKFTAFSAMALGRTLIGERVWDISKGIDAMEYFPEVDTSSILCTGGSGGGTATFYASAFDERITTSVPVCAFCPYKDSILDINHCICNLIPNVCDYFEMKDIAGLIAPRKLMVINGEKDVAFPIEPAKRGFSEMQEIYDKIGAKDKVKMVITPMHHYWCNDIVWNSIREFSKE